MYGAPYKDQLFGYYYRFFSEKAVYKNFVKQIEVYKLGLLYYRSLHIIFKSRYWESKGFDGKTLARDKYAGNISSFFHDYPSRCGFGGKMNDVIFLYLELKSGASKPWAFTQYYVVRAAAQYFILRDYIKGRRVEEPEWLVELYKETKIRLLKEYKIEL